MALPFLRSQTGREGALALKERPEPRLAAAPDKDTSRLSTQRWADIVALTPEARERKARPLPSLTAVAGETAAAREPEDVVRARLQALRAKAAQPKAEPALSVARFAKSMRERARVAQYDRTKAMVGKIEQMEVDLLIELAAKTRARYISKLLEFGRSNKPLSFTASEEVKSLREQHEEIWRGLDLIREALERGEIEIEGVEPV